MSEHQRTAPRERDAEHLQGHWALAEAGKKVLRPGGRELTERLLAAANPRGRRVVELAPGLGLTAERIISLGPASYTGVDQDAAAADAVRDVVGSRGTVVQGDAAATGLPDGQADLVLGEALLTMQTERGKRAIVAEVFRALAPGGRYAIHELAIVPDATPEDVKEQIRRSLAQSIKVNARPLTVSEWRELLESEGFTVDWWDTTEMALLQPRRLLQDEGPRGVLRMLATKVTEPGLRRRILTMRRTFSQNAEHLGAVGIVAHKIEK